MTDRIRCYNCGAESYADGATLYCAGCWHRLQAEVARLREALAAERERAARICEVRAQTHSHSASYHKLRTSRAMARALMSQASELATAIRAQEAQE